MGWEGGGVVLYLYQTQMQLSLTQGFVEVRFGFLTKAVVIFQGQPCYSSEIFQVSLLAAKYNFSFTLGDQDWFTLLGFEVSNLSTIYIQTISQ